MIYASPPNWLIICFSFCQVFLSTLCNFQLQLFWKMAGVFTAYILWFFVERCLPVSSMSASSHVSHKVQTHLPFRKCINARFFLVFKFVFTFFLFIEFVRVTIVNKILQVSSAQFYNTSSVHSMVYSPPSVKSPSITIYPPFTLLHLPPLPSPGQSPHCCLCNTGSFEYLLSARYYARSCVFVITMV